jgi:hypothetical protein
MAVPVATGTYRVLYHYRQVSCTYAIKFEANEISALPILRLNA